MKEIFATGKECREKVLSVISLPDLEADEPGAIFRNGLSLFVFVGLAPFIFVRFFRGLCVCAFL